MKKKKNKKSLRMSGVLLAIAAIIIMVTALTMAGDLEPTAPPGPTMKTLNEIPPTWSQTYSTASDRFVLVLYDDAVLDRETGLVWARNANIPGGTVSWEGANTYCRNLEIGNRKGWRLPMVEELASLVDPASSDPALPPGYSSFFYNVNNDVYWSSTTRETDTVRGWGVQMTTGEVEPYPKTESHRIWPVRGGSGPILVPHTS
jgi:hypothetical protein